MKKTVTELTERFVKEQKEIMNFCGKKIGMDAILDMDVEQIELFKRMFKFLNIMNELVIRQAEVIDDMDNKLNEVNEKLNKLLSK